MLHTTFYKKASNSTLDREALDHIIIERLAWGSPELLLTNVNQMSDSSVALLWNKRFCCELEDSVQNSLNSIQEGVMEGRETPQLQSNRKEKLFLFHNLLGLAWYNKNPLIKVARYYNGG